MNKSILVLDENSLIHGLVASALDIDGLTLHHEFNPSRFVERVEETTPDLILLSNTDQKSDYATCKALKSNQNYLGIPLVLMANSNDSVSESILTDLHIEGLIRKPFEASDLQQQVSKHLNMIDLVGSGYEYRKSQSLREEDANPLAGIDVLDSEVLGLLQGSGPDGQASGDAVPDVDFSQELAQEDSAAGTLVMDADELAEELQPESAFEAIDEPAPGLALSEEQALEAMSDPDMAEEASLEELDAADVLEEETPGESAMPTAFDQPLDAEGPVDDSEAAEFPAEPSEMADFDGSPGTIEELTDADLLEEELPGESAAPSEFDKPLQEQSARAVELQPLDEVEVELAEADVDFEDMEDELDDGGVAQFEANLDEPSGTADEPAGSADIPPTVRRMMDLKPAFSMTPQERAQHLNDGSAVDQSALPDEPSDDELDQMAAELGSEEGLPDVPEEAVLDDDFGTLDPEESLSTADYDGVDEERVSSALKADSAEGLGEGEFAEALDNGELVLDEDMEVAPLDGAAPAAVDVASEDRDDEIAIDLDEESLIMSPLDEEEISDANFSLQDPAAELEKGPGATLDEVAGGTDEDAEQEGELVADSADGAEGEFGIEAFKEFPQMQGAEPLEVDIPETFPTEEESLEPEPGGMQGESENEGLIIDDELLGDGEELSLDMDITEAHLTLEDEQLLGLEQETMDELQDLEASLEDIPQEPAAAEDTAAGGESEGLFQDDLTPPDEEEPFLDSDAASVDESVPEPGLDLEQDDDDLSFEDDFAALRAEIEANPEGEKLSDILRQEGISEGAEDIDFDMPEEEDSFARAMGTDELPAEAIALPDDDALPDTGPDNSEAAFTEEVMRGAVEPGGEAPASFATSALTGLDEQLKARLSDVLDEVITTSVRRVVQEEMPKLVEQMEKDQNHP